MGEEQGAVSASVNDAGTPATPGGGADSPERLREEIEQTRQELGDTVAALADKTDVKARARDRVAEVRQTVAGKRDEVRHTVTEKRDEVVERARETTPQSAGTAAVQLKDKAQQNPIPVAAVAAFVGGFLLGRITAR